MRRALLVVPYVACLCSAWRAPLSIVQDKNPVKDDSKLHLLAEETKTDGQVNGKASLNPRRALAILVRRLASLNTAVAFSSSIVGMRFPTVRCLRATSMRDRECLKTADAIDHALPASTRSNTAHRRPSPYSIELHEGSLKVLDRAQLAGVGVGKHILHGVSSHVANYTASPTGGLFLHTAYESARHEHTSSLGTLHCHRLLACARVTRFWMGPAFGRRAHQVPHDTQFLLIELEVDGPYVLMLPLVDNGTRASLRGEVPPWRRDETDRGDKLVLHTETGDPKATVDRMRALYVAADTDPFALLHRGFAEVAEVTGSFRTLEQKQLPPSVDGFGWCTWDAFYSDVTPAGVLQGIKALRAAGVPAQNLILDDGWQQVDPAPGADDDTHHGRTGDDERKQPTEVSPSVTRLRRGLLGALAAITAWVASRLMRAVEALFTAYYNRCVKRCRPGSLATKVWPFFTRGILKKNMQKWFHDTGNFGRKLSGFTANKKFERDGHSLRGLVAQCKELGVRHVYCWHALAGYWAGVSSELGKRSNLDIVQAQPEPSHHMKTLEPQIDWDAIALFGLGLLTDEEQLAQFYQQLHAPLAAAGVDGVKVDVQSGVPAVGDGIGAAFLAGLFTKAMETSVAKHFSADDRALNCINCMCHSTENLYQYSRTAVARASEDFFPNETDTHTVHIVNVAYNSIFLGEICLPDWDMFHSLHDSAGLHAAARAVGGCPVYVSDVPGHSDVPLLRRLVLPDGSVLRAQLPGRPTRDSLFKDVGADSESALKVWNANAVGGVVGAFNVQGVAWSWQTRENVRLHSSPPPVTAHVRPRDVETLRDEAGPFAVWRHRSARVEVLPTADAIATVELGNREWEIFTVVPVQTRRLEHSAAERDPPVSISWAPLGLGEMLNSGGALLHAGDLIETPGSAVQTKLSCRGFGLFHAYCRPAPSRVHVTGGISDHQDSFCFRYDDDSGKLEIRLPEVASVNFTVLWEGI